MCVKFNKTFKYFERYGHGGAETQGAGGSLPLNTACRGRRFLRLLALFKLNRSKRKRRGRKRLWDFTAKFYKIVWRRIEQYSNDLIWQNTDIR